MTEKYLVTCKKKTKTKLFPRKKKQNKHGNDLRTKKNTSSSLTKGAVSSFFSIISMMEP